MVPAFHDLLGTPYKFLGRSDRGASCMWVPLELHRRAGHEPIDPIEDPIGASTQWDVVYGSWREMDILLLDYRGCGIGGHVAIVVKEDPDGFALHSTVKDGITLIPLSDLSRKVIFGYRWRNEAKARDESTLWLPKSQPEFLAVGLQEWRGPLGPKREINPIAHTGGTIWDYLPTEYQESDTIDVRLNGRPIHDDELYVLRPAPGDVISVRPIAGWVSLIMLVIGVALKIGEYHLTKHQKAYARRRSRRLSQGSYAFDVMGNSLEDGSPVPVVMGTHRAGGIVLSQFTSRFEEGRDKFNVLLALSEGPINGISDIHFDGNAASNYGGFAYESSTGLISPGALPNYKNSVTTTAHNTQLTYGSPVTVSGTVTADQTILKVTFITGLYYIDDQGDPHSAEFFYRIRYRLSAGPGAWSNYNIIGICNATSTSGTSRLYIKDIQALTNWIPSIGPFAGTQIRINSGGARDETRSISAVGIGYIDVTPALTYTHTAAQADEVTIVDNFKVDRRRADAFSIWHTVNHPTSAQYDIEIERRSADHDASESRYSDAYLKEQNEVDFDDYSYPRTALLGVRGVATDQLNGAIPRVTVLVDGIKVNAISSATAVGAAAHTQNPADLMLGLLYNRRWGCLNEIDGRIELTMTGETGSYTVGETVTGTDDGLQFIGVVKSHNITTHKLVVESQQALPYGTLTGSTSAVTGTVSSIDDLYGCSLTDFYNYHTFNNGYVPDGSGDGSTVDQNSTAGTTTLYVAATTDFTTDDYIVINPDGAYQETAQVQSISAGVSLTLYSNLTYNHTAAQAHAVKVAEVRNHFDFVWDGDEDAWEALQRIGKTSRCIPVRYGAYVKLVILKSETPSGLISEGNILTDENGKSTLKMSFPEISTRPNRMVGYYTDETNDYIKAAVAVQDPTAITNNEKPYEIEMDFYGITRSSQAYREANFRLKRLRYTSDPIQFMIGAEHIDFEVGDVRYICHNLPSFGTRGGRVVSSTASTVTLDQPVTVSGGESIRIRHTDDTEEAKTLDATAGTIRVLTITTTWGVNPSEGALYAIGDCQQIRIISIKPDEDLHAEIQAEPDSSAYYVDDWGTVPTWTPSTVPDTNEIPGDVTGLELNSRDLVQPDRSVVHAIDVSFLKPESASLDHCDIWYRSLTSQKLYAGNEYGLGTSTNGEFNGPRGVCTDGTYIYVADEGNDRIVKLAREDLAYVANIGSSGSGNGQFSHPRDVTTDGTHIWVADGGNHRIQKLTVAGAYVAKLGAFGSGNDQFNYPCGISVYGAFIYVSDCVNCRIVKIDAALVGSGGGTWTTIGSSGTGNDQFSYPMGIDADGTNLWVADTRNNRIHKRLCSDLSYVAKLGSQGSGDNQFRWPSDLVCDSSEGHVFIVDSGNYRIARVDTSLTWEAARGTQAYTPPPRMGEYVLPHGIGWGGGDIFVTDFSGSRLNISDDENEVRGRAFIFCGETREGSYRITPVSFGESYEVAVVSSTATGVKKDVSDAPSETIEVASTTTVPPTVLGLYATVNGPDVWLRWLPVNCNELSHYEVRVGTSWALGTSAGSNTVPVVVVQNAPAGVSRTYYVKAITTSNRESATAASTTATAGNPWPWQQGGWGTNWRT